MKMKSESNANIPENKSFKDTFSRFMRLLVDWFCLFYGSLFNLSKKNRIPPITNPMLVCPAITIADKIRKREWLAVDVANAYLNRIKEVNPFVNAIIDLREEAVNDAKRIDEILNSKQSEAEELKKKPLLGVPFTCKDSIQVKGMKLTNGIYNNRENRATEDAELVTLLKNAGAIPIAITNVPEHAIWWDTNNVIIGRTCNPYDLSTTPGGSSGGEGALIGAGGSVFGVGTDTGGSIRLPAFFCGVFGHKPTPETVSTKGIYPQVDKNRESFYSIGPLCRYASDLLPVLKIIMGDNISKIPSINSSVDLSKINIYYMEECFDPKRTPVIDDIKEGMNKAVKHLEEVNKMKCEPYYFAKMRDSLSIWVAVMKSISVKEMDEYLAEGEQTKRVNVYLEFIKRLFGKSKHTSSILFVAMNEKMVMNSPELINQEINKMNELKEEFKSILGENGVFLYPTHPETAPKQGTTIFKAANVGYVSIFNVIKTPVTQCTLGLTKDGMPFGIQVISNENNDHLTIAVALELANAFGGWVPPCAVQCQPKDKNLEN